MLSLRREGWAYREYVRWLAARLSMPNRGMGSKGACPVFERGEGACPASGRVEGKAGACSVLGVRSRRIMSSSWASRGDIRFFAGRPCRTREMEIPGPWLARAGGMLSFGAVPRGACSFLGPFPVGHAHFWGRSQWGMLSLRCKGWAYREYVRWLVARLSMTSRGMGSRATGEGCPWGMSIGGAGGVGWNGGSRAGPQGPSRLPGHWAPRREGRAR
jgi:hypothetical protein